MTPPSTSAAGPEPSARTPLLVLGLLALVTTPVFWLTPLDLHVAALFYDPGAENVWPGEFAPLWSFFYYGAPLFAGLMGIGSLAVLGLSWLRPGLRHLRLGAACVLLTLALGPGLLVNVILKENWGHPRPRQVEQFGGDMHYLPPLAKGKAGTGKSFVAGHASVGFSLTLFWLLWRRRHRRLARAALAAGIGLGLLMGLGRMEAGAHFLSDVLWAGYVTFFSAWLVYYAILRVPRREREPAAIDARPGSPAAAVGYTAVAVFLLMGSAMNLPVNRVLDYRPGPGPVPPTVRLDVDRANVLIRVGPNDAAPLHIHGAVHGFGLPTYQIRQTTTRSGGPRPVLAYTLRQRGWFSELDTRVTVDVGAQVQRVVVKVDDGRVRVVRTAGFPARRSVKAE